MPCTEYVRFIINEGLTEQKGPKADLDEGGERADDRNCFGHCEVKLKNIGSE